MSGGRGLGRIMAGSHDLVIGTAGHIDHGKTSLVRALTGVDTDRLPAEKQRGITIDLGFAALDLPPYHLALVDVPGHERFIRNMLAGATGLDLALLVVAADDSVMPQTREHLQILSHLDLAGGVIALTKADLATADWLALVQDEVRELVAGTFLAAAPIVPTSATTGLGIAELKEALQAVCEQLPARDDPGLFRLAIDRSFTVAGHGTVVTGTVASGRVSVGDELEWWPEGRRVRVRGLQKHDQAVATIRRGNRAALNLAGVHHREIVRGQELATPGYLAATRRLTVELGVSADAPRALRHRQRYTLHLGTSQTTVQLVLLDGTELPPGGSALVQLAAREPIVAVAGEPFVLREESPAWTVGGGRVVQPTASRTRRRDPAALARLEALASGDADARLTACFGRLPVQVWPREALVREAAVPVDSVEPRVAALKQAGDLTELPIAPRRLVPVARQAEDELLARVLRVLHRLHAARPRQSAIRRGELVASLVSLGPDTLVNALIDRLSATRQVAADARTVARTDHVPKLSQGERALKQQLLEAVRRGGFTPPDASEMAALGGSRASVVPELLALLADEGQLVEIGKGVWLDVDTEATLRQRVAERLADPTAGGLAMAELRDLLGTTRKFAVPIGEYLDRVGLTRREGDVRLRPEPAPTPPSPTPMPLAGGSALS